MYVTIFIASLIAAIMFHEFGHYATAKLSNMKVDKFFLGFGPTLWSFRKGETEYGVKAIPAGGFVRIVGMTPFEPVAPEDRGRTFYEQAAWKRAIVLVAGSFTHFIVAAGLMTAAYAAVGVPIIRDGAPVASNVVRGVQEGTPAAEAGLGEGDEIVAVDGVPTPDFVAVRDAVAARPGETVTLTVEGTNDRREIEVTLGEQTPDGRRQGFLGVAPSAAVEELPLPQALRAAITGRFGVVRLTTDNLVALGQAFRPEQLASWFRQVGEEGPRTPEGPMSLVGTAQVVSAVGETGDVFSVLLILASLNIVLGALNLLPLPPLDGGHLATLLVERGVNGVRRLRGLPDTWRINPAVITPVALAVILFFGILTLTAMYVDITRPASSLLQ